MKPGTKRTLKILGLVLVGLAVLALLAPTLLSTRPGRSFAESYASGRLNRTVHIGELDLGWWSGLEVGKVEVAERPDFVLPPAAVVGTKVAAPAPVPFVKFDRLRCPNALLALLGSGTLKELSLTGLEVNIVHLADGRLSTDDLRPSEEPAATAAKPPTSAAATAPTATPAPAKPVSKETVTQEKPVAPVAPPVSAAKPGSAAPAVTAVAPLSEKTIDRPAFTMPLAVQGAKLTFADQKTKTAVVLDRLDVAATYDAGHVVVSSAAGRVNEGTLQSSGDLNLCAAPTPFQVKATLRGVKASANLAPLLGHFAPLLYEPAGLTGALIDFDLTLAGRGFAKPDLRAHLAGESRLKVTHLKLGESPMAHAIAEVIMFGKLLDSDTLTAGGQIAQGRITSQGDGAIRTSYRGQPTMTLAGYTDFDGGISYAVTLEGELSNLNVLDVTLEGTLKKPRPKASGVDLKDFFNSLKPKKIKKPKPAPTPTPAPPTAPAPGLD
jgi:hypothetical protein